jgi:predicted nucleic acid-binding protein
VAEKLTLDTNVLIYSLDSSEPTRQVVAKQVLAATRNVDVVLTAIVLGEFFHVASRKAKAPKGVVRQHLQDFTALFPVVGYEAIDVLRAAQESEAGRFEFWDAIVLSAAERAGCTVCLSEDMQDGAKLGALTVRNPFGARGLGDAARAALGL